MAFNFLSRIGQSIGRSRVVVTRRVALILALVVLQCVFVWYLYPLLQWNETLTIEMEAELLADRTGELTFMRVAPSIAEITIPPPSYLDGIPKCMHGLFRSVNDRTCHVESTCTATVEGIQAFLEAPSSFDHLDDAFDAWQSCGGVLAVKVHQLAVQMLRIHDAHQRPQPLSRVADDDDPFRRMTSALISFQLPPHRFTNASLQTFTRVIVLLEFVRTMWHTACACDEIATLANPESAVFMKRTEAGGNSKRETVDTFPLLGGCTTIRHLSRAATRVFQQTMQAMIEQHGDDLECSEPQVYHLSHLPSIAAVISRRQQRQGKTAPRDHVTPHAYRRLEPLHCDLRNMVYQATKKTISMAPYVPATWLDRTRDSGGRRVLIDFGANEFQGSPKWLIDSYEPFAPFDDVVLIEPRQGRVAIPEYYTKNYKLIFKNGGVRIHGLSEDKTLPPLARQSFDLYDPLQLIREYCRVEDYCVVKFDVDRHGESRETIEWGFMAKLLESPSTLAVIDELYVEMHFFFRRLDKFWRSHHTYRQALDLLRSLRAAGLAVHPWP